MYHAKANLKKLKAQHPLSEKIDLYFFTGFPTSELDACCSRGAQKTKDETLKFWSLVPTSRVRKLEMFKHV